MSAKARVLAVDDNPTNLLILQDALQDEFELEQARDGNEALLLAPVFLPDVVLLDVMMPGMDGYEVCRRLKSKHSLRHCRVIMVSAKTALHDRLLGYDAGADDYITKPFDEEELCIKIDFAVRTKRLEELCGATGEVLALVTELRDTGILESAPWTRECCGAIATDFANKGVYGEEIDARFLDELHHACVLCDVGELAIPPEARPAATVGKFDDLAEHQQHTLVGYRLLNRLANDHPEFSLFRMAAQVARSHHENFDGSGYPDKAAGNAIPLAARIVHVVNFVKEATRRRDASKRLTDEQVRDELLRGRGTTFDPSIVDALLRRFDQLVGSSDECDLSTVYETEKPLA